jgi:hypothetical protein
LLAISVLFARCAILSTADGRISTVYRALVI